MKIKIFYNGQRVDEISDELRIILEERVEMQLIEALESFDDELSNYDYTINISFSENYESLIIFIDGLSYELAKSAEDSIARILEAKPVFADLE